MDVWVGLIGLGAVGLAHWTAVGLVWIVILEIRAPFGVKWQGLTVRAAKAVELGWAARLNIQQ